jgi:hypothetical protein
MRLTLCGNWVRPKCNFFTWLILQNGISTTIVTLEVLAKLWSLSVLQSKAEIDDHLIFGRRYSVRIWGIVRRWVGFTDCVINLWISILNVKDWRVMLSGGSHFSPLFLSPLSIESPPPLPGSSPSCLRWPRRSERGGGGGRLLLVHNRSRLCLGVVSSVEYCVMPMGIRSPDLSGGS